MITLTRYKCRILLVVFCLVCVVESVAYGCGGGGGGFSCPGPCWKWVNGICVSVCSCCGGSCCGGRCCDQKVCYDYHTQNCCWDGSGKTCPIGKECCSGTCCDPKQCKVCDANGHCISRCNASQCKECDGNGNCVSRCNSAECEGCVDGECQVCGGDTNKKCCSGSCCDKVWTKKTTDGIVIPCPSCDGGVCGGYNLQVQSYEVCKSVAAGIGEHCQCNMTEQVTGYVYPCQTNWDVTKMIWCAGRGSWCLAVCIYTMSPPTCANCLAGAGTDCCPGGCEICDFIEACEKNPDDGEEERTLVFSSFGC